MAPRQKTPPSGDAVSSVSERTAPFASDAPFASPREKVTSQVTRRRDSLLSNVIDRKKPPFLSASRSLFAKT